MSEHTKGHWLYDTDTEELRDASGSCIGHIEPASGPLAAAAPDLLEACKLCAQALKDHVQYDDGESLERDAYNAAVAAIAKTEGGGA